MRSSTKSFIFTALSCIGTVASAIMAIHETKKHMEHLDDMHDRGILKTVWDYKGTIATVGLSCAASILSRHTSEKAIAGLVSSLGGAIMTRDIALKDSLSYLPKEERDEILDEQIAEAAAKTWRPDVSVEHTGFGDELCYFAFSGRWFTSSEDAVRNQLKMFNEDLVDGFVYVDSGGGEKVKVGCYAALSEVYEALGLTPDQFGDTYGFAPDYYDEKEGVIFRFRRAMQYTDNTGITHNTNVFVISIDEATWPCDWYLEA